MGSPRESGSGPVVEAFGDPLVDFDRIPADGAHAQAQRLGELALLHQAVDVGALEAGLGFDFIEPQDAALVRWQYRCCDMAVTPERSVAFVGVTSIQ
jgi:hypothetical protein